MLRMGMVFLSIWSSLNLIVALACNFAITLLHQNSPGLRLLFGDSKIQDFDPNVVAAINMLAVQYNAILVALCVLMLVVIWTSLAKKARWAFWGLLIALSVLQVFGFASVSFFDGINLFAQIVSAVILVVGLGLSGFALYISGIGRL